MTTNANLEWWTVTEHGDAEDDTDQREVVTTLDRLIATLDPFQSVGNAQAWVYYVAR